MPSSCPVSDSITMPWQLMVTPVAPLAHASSPPHIRPQAPGHLTSRPARRLCADSRYGCTCERLSIAPSWPPQFGQSRGDGGDGHLREGVERRWDDWHRGGPERANGAMKVQWCVSLINVLPTGCQPFPVIGFFLLPPVSPTRQISCSSQRRTYISLARMPRLTLRRPRGIYLPSKTTRGFIQVRACTGHTRPYDAPRDRASPHWATKCAPRAERRLVHASCGPSSLPPSTTPSSVTS
jgi:hypothetical protein